MTVTRSATSFERIVLRADALPAGVAASFSTTSLYGFDGVSATMSVDGPGAAVPVGAHQVRVVGSEHGLERFAIATIVVGGDPPVASPPTVDAMPRAAIGATTVPARVVWPAAVDPIQSDRRLRDPGQASTAARGDRRPPSARRPGSSARPRRYGHALPLPGPGSRCGRRSGVSGRPATATRPGSSRMPRNRSSTGGRGSGSSTRMPPAATSTTRSRAGPSAKLTFNGRAIGFIAPVGPTRGSAKDLLGREIPHDDQLQGAEGLEPARDVLDRLGDARLAHAGGQARRQRPGRRRRVRHLPLTTGGDHAMRAGCPSTL